MSKIYKIVIFVPGEHADKMRKVVGEAGGGNISNYTFCSFSIKGTGRFKPNKGANPTIGNIGKLEEVSEERIEVVCEKDKLKEVLKAIKENHPYEESATDIYSLEDINSI